MSIHSTDTYWKINYQRPYNQIISYRARHPGSTDLRLEQDQYLHFVGHISESLLSLVRRVYPQVIAQELVGVQPMDSPVGEIFIQPKQKQEQELWLEQAKLELEKLKLELEKLKQQTILTSPEIVPYTAPYIKEQKVKKTFTF